MKKTVIGIDISKKTLDWCIMEGSEIAGYHKTMNSVDDIVRMLSDVLENGCKDIQDVLVCAEFTGRYIYPLVLACHKCGVALWLESGYNIKCEARKERGKDDRTDARRIAEYGRKNQDDARIYRLPSKKIAALRDLMSERALYCSQAAAHKGQLRDMRAYMAPEAYTARAVRQLALIKELERLTEEVDRSMASVIASDPELKRQEKLLLSVPGIGTVCAAALIAVTAGFSLFDNGRELCCFAGLAPFAYTSGTSIRSKRRVSGRADHQLKALMHMCALVAATRIKSGHFAEYYQRKVAEGKNKMCVLNAVRAKLMLTAFAVVRDDTPYDNFSKKNFGES
jgi:transposase